MALTIENTPTNYSLDSGDPRRLNEKQIQNATTTELKQQQPCEAPVKEETKPDALDEISEQNFFEKIETVVPATTLPVSNESINLENALSCERYIVKPSGIILTTLENKDLNTNKTEKTIKRVHFNSEVETFTFLPGLSIIENYNFVEEVSLENSDVFVNVHDTRDSTWRMKEVYWKSEGNLAVMSSCSQHPIKRKRIRCDLHVRKVKKNPAPLLKYSRLNDENVDDVRQTKLLDRFKMKRSKSAYFSSNEAIENRKEDDTSSATSTSLRKRLSMSMSTLKKGAKSFMDKMKKVLKRKEESFPMYDIPEVSAEDAIKFFDRDLKGQSGLQRNNSFSFQGRKIEDEKNSESAMRDNLGERLSKSALNLNGDSKPFMDKWKKFLKKK